MNGQLVACICEGAAEEEIVKKLLYHDCLIFSVDQLLDNKPLRVRNAKKFQDQYLGKSYDDLIRVYRILDSRNEKFSISKIYEKKFYWKISSLTPK